MCRPIRYELYGRLRGATQLVRQRILQASIWEFKADQGISGELDEDRVLPGGLSRPSLPITRNGAQ